MNYHYQFRPKPELAVRIENFKDRTHIHKDSYALQYLVKLGLDSYDMLGVPQPDTGLPLEIETVLDRLTMEQKERLFDILAKKIGVLEMAWIRGGGDLK